MTQQPGEDIATPFNLAHQHSDVDINVDSIHHTLGLGPQQAAPGNHSGHIPVGSTVIYSGSNLPIGYLQANGAAVSRTDFNRLFTIIGTTYGAGDGSTTFNLPNISTAGLPAGMSYIIKT